MLKTPIPTSNPTFWEVTKNMLFPNIGIPPPAEQDKKNVPGNKEEEESQQQQITARKLI